MSGSPKTKKKPATSRTSGRPPIRSDARTRQKTSMIGSGLFAGKLPPDIPLFILEACCLATVGILAVIVVIGLSANRFSGTGLFSHLLPFAIGVLGLIIAGIVLLNGWQVLRQRLKKRSVILPAIVALTLVLFGAGLMTHDRFSRAFDSFRALVGGREEASRTALSHQIFAGYRRLTPIQMQKLIDRSQPYQADIVEAAKIFSLDPDLLFGLAAAESSFYPRTSKDGGQGLFQITQAPAAATAKVNKLVDPQQQRLDNHRYNALLGAATLTHYLLEMNGDLFLGLLAYNIGPRNGGLRFVMEQYGAGDFMTIQPYLQDLPRDYPIRVLAFALAFRVERHAGRLLAYEEGTNALRIQAIGIPGF